MPGSRWPRLPWSFRGCAEGEGRNGSRDSRLHGEPVDLPPAHGRLPSRRRCPKCGRLQVPARARVSNVVIRDTAGLPRTPLPMP